MTPQPQWKLLTNLGDADYIEHDGYFVYVDEAGVYDPEVEVLIHNADETWTIYRFCPEPCVWTPGELKDDADGVLSDNKFHPLHPAWFATYSTDKQSLLTVLTPRQEQEEEVAEGLFDGMMEDW